MKTMILCGGMGTRLAAAAIDAPKPMVPVGGRPIVWHIMRGLAAAGYDDFVLCLGYRSDVFKRYFLDLPGMLGDVTLDLRTGTRTTDPTLSVGWNIAMLETGLDAQTGCRVKRAGRAIPASDRQFAVTYGDGVTDLDFRDVVRFHESHGRLATVTAVHPPGRFGELGLAGDGSVRTFNEKPQAEVGWINGGFFVFDRSVLDRLEDDPSLVLEQEPLQRLAAQGELMAYRHEGFWQCMDTPRDLRTLERLWANDAAPWKVWR